MKNTRICYKCNQDLPRTLEYFGKYGETKDGLRNICRMCRGGKYIKQPREGYKICNRCKEELPAIKKHFDVGKRNTDGLIPVCKKCVHLDYLKRKQKQQAIAKKGVYKIVNTYNGKTYVGSSKNIQNRIKNHISTLKNNYHRSKELQDEYNAQNKNGFEFIIIEEVEDEKLLFERETHWIGELESTTPEKGYNIKAPIEGTGLSRPMSEDEREAISKRLKNRYFSPKHRRRISEANSGKNHWLYGKETPIETKKKLSLANMGRNIGENCGTSKLRNKDVVRIKNMFKQGHSDKEISIKFNVSRSNINAIRNGKTWKHIKI